MSNPIRENLLLAAVARAHFRKEAISVENVRSYLPGPHARKDLRDAQGKLLREQDDFELTEIDLAPHVEPTPAPVEQFEAAPEPVKAESEIGTAGPAPNPRPPKAEAEPPKPEPSPIKPRDMRAEEIIRAEALALANERVALGIELQAAQRAEVAALLNRDEIARLAERGGVPQEGRDAAQSRLIREHLQTSNEERRRRVLGIAPGGARPPIGGSAIDRQAYYGRGSYNSQPNLTGQTISRGKSRGAFSRQEAARLGFRLPTGEIVK